MFLYLKVVSVSLEVEAKSKTGFSTASVIIVLKRLKGYFYLNVFTQFVFLIAIGFMSLTFPVNNFSDRVMTALTILLVMTCNQQAGADIRIFLSVIFLDDVMVF